ncbi:hypothetical protein EG829_25540, partial [bacterium]|nr:hypothetical protein [bacterium]
MKKIGRTLIILQAVVALTAGCSSFSAVELPSGFWQREGVRIGIVMTGTDKTRVRIETPSLFEPMLPGYKTSILGRRTYDPGGGFGSRGNRSAEIEEHGRSTEQWSYPSRRDIPTLLRADADALRLRFRDLNNGAFREVRERLMQALAQEGRQVTFMDAGKEVPGEADPGVDVLMTIDCQWYG